MTSIDKVIDALADLLEYEGISCTFASEHVIFIESIRRDGYVSSRFPPPPIVEIKTMDVINYINNGQSDELVTEIKLRLLFGNG